MKTVFNSVPCSFCVRSDNPSSSVRASHLLLLSLFYSTTPLYSTTPPSTCAILERVCPALLQGERGGGACCTLEGLEKAQTRLGPSSVQVSASKTVALPGSQTEYGGERNPENPKISSVAMEALPAHSSADYEALKDGA